MSLRTACSVSGDRTRRPGVELVSGSPPSSITIGATSVLPRPCRSEFGHSLRVRNAIPVANQHEGAMSARSPSLRREQKEPRFTDVERQPFRSTGFVSVIIVSGLFALGLPLVLL